MRDDFGDIDPEIIRDWREGLTRHNYTPDLCGCDIGTYRAGGIAISGLGRFAAIIHLSRSLWDGGCLLSRTNTASDPPVLIAITGITRLIILQGKDFDPSILLFEAGAIFLLAVSFAVLTWANTKLQKLKPLIADED